MSEIRVNVLGADRIVHGCLHEVEGDRILAALAADPRTVEELALAVGRYRHIDEGADRFLGRRITAADLAAETDHLQRHGQDWLNGPDDDFDGRTPASIIDRERRRLPEACAPGEPMIDPDCPLCQMMADETFGPAFWHLDGAEMDDEFAFSFCETREAWEEEQRCQEEFDRKFDQERRRERAFVDGALQAEEFLEITEEDRRIWKQSFSDLEAVEELPFPRAIRSCSSASPATWQRSVKS